MTFYEPQKLTVVSAPGAQRRLAYENETLFLEINLEAGYKSTPHDHTWATLYYFTQGQARVTLGQEIRDAEAGTLVMIPANTLHGIEAVSAVSFVEVQSNCPPDFVEGILTRGGPGR